jgi:hypothetical protein
VAVPLLALSLPRSSKRWVKKPWMFNEQETDVRFLKAEYGWMGCVLEAELIEQGCKCEILKFHSVRWR